VIKPVAIVTDFHAVSFTETSMDIAKVLRQKGIACTIYNIDATNIKEHNIIFNGNVFSLSISYVQRFLPEKNVIFYAITEGVPILDTMSRQLSQKVTYITPSLYAKQCLETVGLDCEEVIPHGIELNEKHDRRYYEYLKQTLPQPSKVEPSNVVLNISGNWRRKAIDKFLVACKTLEKVVPDVFAILHSGIGDINIVQLQNELMLHRFWFTNMWGILPKPKVYALYALCNYYCQPSEVEGFGLTYLEAFKFNKPVIAVDCPATNEIVKHGYTGLLMPVTGTDDIVWHDRHAIRLHHFEVDALIDAMVAFSDEKFRLRFSENIKKEKAKWEINKCYSRFINFLD
jgi:glycosyltransferase involved in cell wall biosynthesis